MNSAALDLPLWYFSSENKINLENLLRNCSFCTLLVSMIFYWMQTAFSLAPTKSLKKEVSELKPSSTFSLSPPIMSGGSSIFFNKESNFGFGTKTMILSNFLLMCLLIFRWEESGHFPLSNLYESLMFLSWSCTFIHLILEYQTASSFKKIRPDSILLTKLLGSITSPSALFTNAFATFSLPIEMQKASSLVPALQSNWLMMHVTVMIISYSALILGSLLSIAFLILINVNPSSRPLAPVPLFITGAPPQTPFGVGPYDSATLGKAQRGSAIADSTRLSDISKRGEVNQEALSFSQAEKQKVHLPKGLNLHSSSEGRRGTLIKGEENLLSRTKNNLAWNFDNLSYRVVGIGFPFLTIGILSGAVWANEAWGSYWSWDPKETWALLTWLIFAIYLHARITKGWQGKKPAIIASFGFLAIWVCFLGVNLIGEGLHSYGWFSLS